MICYVLAMGKQHIGPHVVVGYGIKIFWPGLFITSPDHLAVFRWLIWLLVSEKFPWLSIKKRTLEAEQKVSHTWSSVICNFWKNHTILNDIDSKRSSNRCFRGHNWHPRVTALCTLLNIYFEPSEQFFTNFCNLKEGNLYTKVIPLKTTV